MKNGRITRSDIRNFTSYVNQMDEGELIIAFYNLQALRKKYGGVIINKDYQVLNQIIQWRAFCVIGNSKPKKIPFWMLPDFSKQELDSFIRDSDENMCDVILRKVNEISKKRFKHVKRHLQS